MCAPEDVTVLSNSVEHTIYYAFSSMFLFGRATVMFLLAAHVNTEAFKPVLTLQHVHTSQYNIEVQRFIRQVRYTTNALGGYLFYITREMLLVVFGTIVKYELVLLQSSPV